MPKMAAKWEVSNEEFTMNLEYNIAAQGFSKHDVAAECRPYYV